MGALGQRPVRPEQGILKRLLRLLVVPEQVMRIPLQAATVAPDQLRIGAQVALSGPQHQVGIGRAHRG